MKKFTMNATASVSALLCVPLWASAQVIDSFTIVNADTGKDIETLKLINNSIVDGTVNVRSYPNIGVRANASSVKSVRFEGTAGDKTEDTSPYSYKGNNGNVYNTWKPVAGDYLIKAKP